MPLDLKAIRKQQAAIQRKLGRRWDRRYPRYRHQKDHPLALPRLLCRILDMGHENNQVTVKAQISNIGSGASYHTKLQFYYAVLPLVVATPVGTPPPPPPPPLHQLLTLKRTESFSLQPGETCDFTFSTAQPFVINNWQAVVVCFDPTADTLPMAEWHNLLQPMDNLLKGADNPPASPPIPHWEEFDSPTATQPRTANRTWRGRASNPEPPQQTGAWGLPLPNPTYFAPYASASVSELRQTVPTSPFTSLIERGDMVFTLRGLVRSYDQNPPDQAQMLLECLANNATVLETLDLGRHASPDSWKALSGSLVAPPGTTQLRVRLRSTRRSGSNNDGYYDAVRLFPAHRQISTAQRATFL